MTHTPTLEQQRIESLDVIRGFALLGILLLNIISFAMPAHFYFSPLDALQSTSDMMTWAVFEIGAEGAMRCLFSILFGAGVALFLDPAGGKTASLHYRRTFWLMMFGLVDLLLLLWVGDVLFVYALAGFLLYFVRNVRASRLLTAAVALIVLMSLQNLGLQVGTAESGQAAEQLAAAADGDDVAELEMQAELWHMMHETNQPSAEVVTEELAARTTSYATAFSFSLEMFVGLITFVIPVILLWDTLAMMLLGMALYKYGILQGDKSTSFYWRLALCGFALGLSVNSYEAYTAYNSGFAVVSTFPYMQWTYHLGRLGMAMGYLGLLVLAIKYDLVGALRHRLAAVGRMALTNYLSHSLICMLLFTGAGFGLAGVFSRAEIYGFVLAIWIFQLWLSPWWLQRYNFGPVEWLWRGLTYGRFAANKRAD